MLKLKLLITAHCGRGGHRTASTTMKSVREYSYWNSIEEDVNLFCRSCINGLATSPGERIPRPLGHALHAEKPNTLLHFDFCYIGKSSDGYTYVLIMKDDLSSYVWLVPCKAADAEHVADCMVNWFATFGTVQHWVSDRGSHFKNSLIHLIRDRIRGRHHFTLAYCPWSNGTVEVVCRELLKCMRALMSELQLPFKSWNTVTPLVQSVLNSTTKGRLGNRSPLTVFTALPSDNPLSFVQRRTNRQVQTLSIDEARVRQIGNIEALMSAVCSMHKDVAGRANKAREDRVRRHNAKTNVRECNFDQGDFVLKGVLLREKGPKLSLRWKGPFRISEVKTDFLFQVEDLHTGKKSSAHVAG